MWIDRISFLTSHVLSGRAGRALKAGLSLTWLVFSLTACAQPSDLVKVEKDLGGKITKLDQEKKALAQVLKQAKQEIADDLEQQKAELNEKIVKARAQLNEEIKKARAQLKSELRSLEKEVLPQKISDLDAQFHQVRKKLEKGFEAAGPRAQCLEEIAGKA